jgi:putative AlgH/UPF0301 family transcriptional regulator
MPGMGDARFDRSVIYMFAHDDEGAMGFTVNRPTDGLTLGEIASNLPASVSETGFAKSAGLCRRAGATRKRLCAALD